MRRLSILLIEDDENDILLVQHAMERSGAGHKVHAVRDGEGAIRYLRGEAEYSERRKHPLPNIILCDLKMPRMGGLEFLRWLRDHPESSVIPTIVLSSSHLEGDVGEAYYRGANSYMTKPTGLDELVEMLRITFEYWALCECPPTPSGVE